MEQRTPVNLRKTIINGFLLFASIALVAAVLYPVLRQPRPHTHIRCLSNLKQIGIGLNMYMQDSGGKYPLLSTLDQQSPQGKSWPDQITPYIKNTKIFRCPYNKMDRLTYSYNRKLSGVSGKEIGNPADIVLIFDSVSNSELNNNLNGDTVWNPDHAGIPKTGQYVICPKGWEPSGDVKWPKWTYPNHDGVINVLYADTHVKTNNYNETARQTPVFAPIKKNR